MRLRLKIQYKCIASIFDFIKFAIKDKDRLIEQLLISVYFDI